MLLDYVVLAAEATSTSSIENSLLNYGVLGVFSLVMIFMIRVLLKREQDRADRLETEVTRLNGIIQEKTIPALLDSVSAVKASQDFLRELEHQRKLEAEVAALAARKMQNPGSG